MESSKKMRPALKITIAFLAVAALLTFFSKTLYNRNIPTVRTAPITSGNLRKVYEVQGVVSPVDVTGVFADDTLKVLELHVEKGQKVKTGDALVTLDVSPLERELATAAAEYEKLAYYLSRTRGADAVRLAEMDVEAARLNKEALEQKIAQNRVLTAPADGTVVAADICAGMYTGVNVPVIEIADAETGCAVYVSMDAKLATVFSTGDVVSIEYQGGWANLEGRITDMTANAGGDVTVTVAVTGSVGYGEVVNLRFSKGTVEYPYLVPLDALVDGSYVFVIDSGEGVLGTETTMRRVRVTVEDTDSETAAVTGSFEGADTVVTGSTAAMENGRVKIRNEG